ncbi:shikimate kinase [Desmospora profundinema]|uniref:Shikimate kinase n=1 Tax=Desmospora profundinema TaxID=1571184 RepID=A0ABU1IMA0_9BACL|nr:shikimate kinase [Desmospora profundinema]MDR6224905.1 shikimate kinase [Desmospora profundinema]
MEANRHLIIVGMMGTGKTALGEKLAPLTGLRLVDTDAEVERKAAKSIPLIFLEEGEAGFRRLEKEVLTEVLMGPPSLITTGGGIVLNPDNVEAMKKAGWVVALKADPDELIHRLRGDTQRPLLAGDLVEKVRRLSRERKHAYDFADFILDTTGLTPEEAAHRVWEAWKQSARSERV